MLGTKVIIQGPSPEAKIGTAKPQLEVGLSVDKLVMSVERHEKIIGASR